VVVAGGELPDAVGVADGELALGVGEVADGLGVGDPESLVGLGANVVPVVGAVVVPTTLPAAGAMGAPDGAPVGRPRNAGPVRWWEWPPGEFGPAGGRGCTAWLGVWSTGVP
jgi:hypothetical protein